MEDPSIDYNQMLLTELLLSDDMRADFRTKFIAEVGISRYMSLVERINECEDNLYFLKDRLCGIQKVPFSKIKEMNKQIQNFNNN